MSLLAAIHAVPVDAPHGGAGANALWSWYLVFVLVVFLASLASTMSGRPHWRRPTWLRFTRRPPPRAV